MGMKEIKEGTVELLGKWMSRVEDYLFRIKREVIFVLVLLGVVVPLLFPIGFPVKPTPETESVFNTIENLKPGEVILLVYDFGPSSKPELYPMAIAILHHAFRKNVRVLTMALWPNAVGLINQSLKEVAPLYGKVEGVDYVNLGYKPGFTAVILQMGEDISRAFPTDNNNKPINSLPMMRDVKNYNDISYIIDLAAGNTPGAWIAYAYERYKVKLGIGVTAVMATNFYPNLQAKQINGLIGGLKGAAEYEKLVGIKGLASRGMDAQSIVHILIILLIILGNIAYFRGYDVVKKISSV